MSSSILKKSPSTTTTTTSSTSSSRKRRISFYKRVQVAATEHHRDFSREEFECYWHTLEDYKAMREEVKFTIDYYNRLDCESALEASSLCLRGLEHRTNSCKGLKAHFRRQAWNSVLEEQDIQHDLGSRDNTEMVREAYRIYSLPASRIAQQKGWNDAIEAESAVVGSQPPSMDVIIKSRDSDSDTSLSPRTVMRHRERAKQNSIASQAA